MCLYLKSVFSGLVISDLIQLGVLAVTILGFGIGINTYRRGKTFDLQNQVHLKKLEAFEVIVKNFIELLSIIQETSLKIHEFDFEELSISRKLEIEKLANTIDKQTDQARNEIMVKSIYFSPLTLESIQLGLDKFYGEVSLSTFQNKTEVRNWIEDYIQNRSEILDKIIIQMREELRLDQINQKLSKRIKLGFFKIKL